MSTYGEIIPLASRRRAPEHAPAPTAAQPLAHRSAPTARWGSLGAALLVILTIAAVGGLGLYFETRARVDVAALSPVERAAIFRRAHDDLVRTCGLPDATEGALRDHCVETARFVLLFPECGDACIDAARALLPHARR
ncbi:MAG TPA: hypothetical protein VLA14_07345 [Polyangia bacterium]|jgi:hypothetical protein|nr:hypothetical protein [Polyangia bacterium]